MYNVTKKKELYHTEGVKLWLSGRPYSMYA